MNPKNTSKTTYVAMAIAASTLLTGCGGAKVLKEPVPMERGEPVAVGKDDNLEAALDWVIVSNGPGSWSKKATWDEYQIRVGNTAGQPIELIDMVVYDMRSEPVHASSDRRALVDASKDVGKRYKDEGVQVEPGVGASSLLAAGAVSAAVGIGTAASAPILMTGATAGVALTGMVLMPVLLTGGVVNVVNGHKIADEIELRATTLPLGIAAGETQTITAFYPVTPSPTRIALVYSVDGRQETLVIDTGQPLAGLNIGNDGKKQRKQQYGQSSWAHRRDVAPTE
jgi:hypothetical protein